MKRLISILLLICMIRLFSFAGGNKSNIRQVWNGKIYQTTVRGASFPFDHADYGVFIPEGVSTIRGVLIHQHGCGMEQFGLTIPFDVQYQAFARKWHLAVVEPVLYGDCHKWRDPESGSGPALLQALDEIGHLSGHSELNTAPWLLWGHSGGGYWALAMMKDYPERILAVFSYSPAFDPQWQFPAAAAKIPLLIRHAGSNDGNQPEINCWGTALHVFSKLRKMNAPVSIAYTPGQNHNFSYVRYMAIPFYEAALSQRLPSRAFAEMKELDRTKAWLGDTVTFQLCKASAYTGSKEGLCWLPDSATAAKWKEYVTTGSVADQTPPPAPYDLQVRRVNDSIEFAWKADADIESGIKRFNIYKDGVHVGLFPESGIYQRFDTNGDNAVPSVLPDMKYRIAAPTTKKTVISIRTVNHFDLESKETKIVCRPASKR